MRLQLVKEEIDAMVSHAEREYPNECIGVITGIVGDSSSNEIKELTNSQESFHESDPEHFKRSARTGYFVDPKEVFELNRKVGEEGKKIVAFYHSHPDNESYFSNEDHSAAVIWGEPVYPDSVYIIISIFDGKVREALVFSWDGKKYSPTEKLPVES